MLAVGVATALSCTLVTAAGAVTAKPPKWQVVYRKAGIDIEAIAATGPKNAWAIGLDGHNEDTGLLLHWNGAHWRSVAYPGERSFLPMAVYALSATDMWLAEFSGTLPTSMLHWKDGKWSTLQLPPNATPMAVIGDNDIWIEGGNVDACPVPPKPNCTTTARWNGSTWTSYPLAATGLFTAWASSPSNVWAVGGRYYKQVRLSHHRGFTTTFRPYVFRWTGSAWHPTSLITSRTGAMPSIVAYSPRDVYVAQAPAARPKACATHWNGSRWSPLYLPGSSGSCSWLAPDYQHGFWIDAPGSYGYGFIFVHWTGRRFVRTPAFVPAGNFYDGSASLAAVPHSASVWLLGNICTSATKCVDKGTIALLR